MHTITHLTFDNFTPEPDHKPDAQDRSATLQIAPMKLCAGRTRHVECLPKTPKAGCYSTGAYGCGKTHLAAAIANQRLAPRVSQSFFMTAPDLLDHVPRRL